MLIANFGERLLSVLGIYLACVCATVIDLDRECPPLPANISIRQLGANDLDRAVAQTQLDISANFVAGALTRGDYGFGAFDGEQLVAYVWRTAVDAPLDSESMVRFKKPYSYLYKSFTLQSHRGLRIAPNLYRYADRLFLSMGYTHRCAFIPVCNTASLNAAKQMGSQLAGYAGYLDWFGRKRFFRTPAVRKIGFELYAVNRNRAQTSARD